MQALGDEWEDLTLINPWIIIALEEMSLIGAAQRTGLIIAARTRCSLSPQGLSVHACGDAPSTLHLIILGCVCLSAVSTCLPAIQLVPPPSAPGSDRGQLSGNNTA